MFGCYTTHKKLVGCIEESAAFERTELGLGERLLTVAKHDVVHPVDGAFEMGRVFPTAERGPIVDAKKSFA